MITTDYFDLTYCERKSNTIFRYIALLIVLIIYVAANIYIGWRSSQAFGPLPNSVYRLYWCTIALLVSAYPIAHLTQNLLPVKVNSVLEYVGALWLGILYYAVLLWLLADLLLAAARWLNLTMVSFNNPPHWVGTTIIAALVVIVGYGWFNARSTVIRHYDLTIAKPAATSSLHAVMLSDTHLGNIIGSERLTELVATINKLQPDIVLLAGDVVEANLEPFTRQNMGSILKQINAPLGVYAVIGNHEYLGQQADLLVSALEDAGLTVLRDQAVTINGIVIAGRDDYSRIRFLQQPRAPLSVILNDIDRAQPIILLDHQPIALDEACQQGVDLQLSGHTHLGQLYPNHLLTSRLFEVDWGYYRKQALQVIVSSGYGTWGPPIRTESQSEIIDIKITFTPD